jgi:hypothetical protein
MKNMRPVLVNVYPFDIFTVNIAAGWGRFSITRHFSPFFLPCTQRQNQRGLSQQRDNQIEALLLSASRFFFLLITELINITKNLSRKNNRERK